MRLLTTDIQLLELIDRGGFGEVYRAHQRSLDRDVAVKILRPDVADRGRAVSRFRREARILSRLAHPHVVSVIDHGETPEGELFLVMELLTGRPLATVLAEGKMSPDRVATLGAQLADALATAHEAGVVHRDLTPRNVFVRHHVGAARDFATILDFGLARLLGQDAQSSSHGAGTTRYMSPEQILGEAGDARSDLYALGLLLFEMLAGRRPFDEQSGPLETLMAHVNEQPLALATVAPETPEYLANLISDLLAKDPDERPVGAAVVRQALLQREASPAPPEVQAPRRNLWPVLALALVAAVSVSVSVIGWTISERPDTSPTADAPPDPAPRPTPATAASPRRVRAGQPTETAHIRRPPADAA
ncbi:MAG: serine/threonine protein kinase, partial [Myxococcota bacterium]